MYTENYKTLLKEIKDDQNEEIRDFTYWKSKVAIPSKLIYTFNIIPIKVPTAFSRN